MWDRLYLGMGAVSAALAVGCGAFGAHALKAKVTAGLLAPERLETWHTAAQYQMWHALAIILVAIALHLRVLRPGSGLLIGFLAGTVLFSGSLYALVLSDQAVLGAVTPLGGLTWIATWLALAWNAWESRLGTDADGHPLA
ncbi:MAG: DUF423 domain-containing protein [Candidatus Sericytochromatia bacterium]|nr:DUF423 domain-containing protein [Candidatus Sericytochromatia bacterium]